MYFFSEEERKLLLKSYLPKARRMEIAEELRGWNWHEAPLTPVYDLTLAIYETANGYCPTHRDLYLRRVLNIKAKPNLAMVEGAILHQTLAHVFVKAKELIYRYGPDNLEKILRELAMEDALEHLLKASHNFSEDERKIVQQKAKVVFAYELTRINARLTELLTKQPYIGKDSLAALTVPVVVEQKLDGRFLGLSANLSVDAYTFNEPMILDLKFGEPRDFHRLATTGYALVMEAIHEYPDQRDLIAAITRKLQSLNLQKAEELGKLLGKRLGYPVAGLTILTGYDLSSPLEQDFLAHYSEALKVKLGQEQKAAPEASRKPINHNPALQLTSCRDLNQEVNWLFTQLSQQNLDPSQRVLCLFQMYIYIRMP